MLQVPKSLTGKIATFLVLSVLAGGVALPLLMGALPYDWFYGEFESADDFYAAAADAVGPVPAPGVTWLTARGPVEASLLVNPGDPVADTYGLTQEWFTSTPFYSMLIERGQLTDIPWQLDIFNPDDTCDLELDWMVMMIWWLDPTLGFMPIGFIGYDPDGAIIIATFDFLGWHPFGWNTWDDPNVNILNLELGPAGEVDLPAVIGGWPPGLYAIEYIFDFDWDCGGGAGDPGPEPISDLPLMLSILSTVQETHTLSIEPEDDDECGGFQVASGDSPAWVLLYDDDDGDGVPDDVPPDPPDETPGGDPIPQPGDGDGQNGDGDGQDDSTTPEQDVTDTDSSTQPGDVLPSVGEAAFQGLSWFEVWKMPGRYQGFFRSMILGFAFGGLLPVTWTDWFLFLLPLAIAIIGGYYLRKKKSKLKLWKWKFEEWKVWVAYWLTLFLLWMFTVNPIYSTALVCLGLLHWAIYRGAKTEKFSVFWKRMKKRFS